MLGKLIGFDYGRSLCEANALNWTHVLHGGIGLCIGIRGRHIALCGSDSMLRRYSETFGLKLSTLLCSDRCFLTRTRSTTLSRKSVLHVYE
jgi:hypothetical protein